MQGWQRVLVHQAPMTRALQAIVVALIVTPCSGLEAPGAGRRKLLETPCKFFDLSYGGSVLPMGASRARDRDCPYCATRAPGMNMLNIPSRHLLLPDLLFLRLHRRVRDRDCP